MSLFSASLPSYRVCSSAKGCTCLGNRPEEHSHPLCRGFCILQFSLCSSKNASAGRVRVKRDQKCEKRESTDIARKINKVATTTSPRWARSERCANGRYTRERERERTQIMKREREKQKFNFSFWIVFTILYVILRIFSRYVFLFLKEIDRAWCTYVFFKECICVCMHAYMRVCERYRCE